ncbi:MAG: ribose-phosphate pyrophosphokinase [Crenarchaeota archaeon]|nr:ribose-phosphate pyrophosphokinase [Thermoproteota archaeon]
MALILTFPESAERSRKLASDLGIESVSTEYKVFPDGEDYVRVPVDVKDIDVIVLSDLYPDQDRKIFRTLLLLDTLRDLGARRIVLVCPYLAYSRQDRRFRDGEAVSLKTLIKIFENLGADYIVTVDVHKPQAFSGSRAECINVEPFEKYARYVKENIGEDVIVLSPDIGSLWRAEKVAKILGTSYDYFEKHRDRVTGQITMRPRQVDVRDKKVLIIDDIIATGGTIREATKILKNMGAREIHVIATHCQFLNNADKKIIDEGVKSIICTDTIECNHSKITVFDIIAEHLRRLIT